MINVQQLMMEDPRFSFFATAVMDELVGMSADEWVYQLWKAYQQGLTPSQFVKSWEDGDVKPSS